MRGWKSSLDLCRPLLTFGKAVWVIKIGGGTQNRKGKKDDITKRLNSPIEPNKRNINSEVILRLALL